MKLAAELLVGVAVCGIAYYLARPDRVEEAADTSRSSVDEDSSLPGAGDPASPAHVPPRAVSSAVDHRPHVPVSVADAEQQRAMLALRNALIVAASADMQRRDDDVAKCLAALDLAGNQKLRFAVEVTSTPHKATAQSWRLVEIVDGEELPASFATCAAAALGGGYDMTPPDGFEFPTYSGEILILYTWPARASAQ